MTSPTLLISGTLSDVAFSLPETPSAENPETPSSSFPSLNVIKLFLITDKNKLECFSLSSLNVINLFLIGTDQAEK
jgi:hypothetical protein